MKKYLSYLAVLGISFIVGIYLPKISAEFFQTDTYNFGSKTKTLEEDVIDFHTLMNDTTNDFLDGLLNEDEPNLEYPLNSKDCGGDNVSTFCLAVKLNEIYTAYETGLLSRVSEIEMDVTTIDQLAEATQNSAEKNNYIQSELNQSLETMELTLAVYNEVQNVYPAHNRLLKTREALEDYRNNLADVRDLIELYPSRFNGVSTNSCQ